MLVGHMINVLDQKLEVINIQISYVTVAKDTEIFECKIHWLKSNDLMVKALVMN